MVSELMLEATNLMFIGMGAVFSFLLLLVFIVQLISKIMLRYFPVAPVERAVKIETSPTGTSPAVVAAIAAAVHQHRQQH